jgi:adenine phosphoribosyltransferase
MQQVLIIDDLLATGGTMLAACNLIDRLGGSVEECAFIISLPDLKGKEKLEKEGRNVFSIVEFEGE